MPSFFPESHASAGDESKQVAANRGIRLIESPRTELPALLDLRDPPKSLWARGTLAIADAPAVAIVGTRNATPYGLRITRGLAAACARAGVCVVSGLARGIDGAAHAAALAAGGRTVAVLGTGVDRAFPTRHRDLQERVAEEGLLLSEYPPGSTGHRGAFPMRNRIIAALASIVIVVEAGVGSGALITVNRARELGRRIGIVPGPVDSPASAGSNAILGDYDALLSADMLLQWLAIDPSPPLAPALDADAAQCWDAIARGATSVQDIATLSGLSPRTCVVAISALELDGLVVLDIAGRVHPAVAVNCL